MVTILAEKYSVAAAIAELFAGDARRIVNKNDGRFGYWKFDFQGEDAVLVYAIGHIIQLAEPKTYGPEFAKWNENVFPLLPEPHRRVVPDEYRSAFADIEKYMKAADWLINATDNDREGDIIFREIYDYLELNKPYKKAIFDDPTPDAIITAFANLQEGKERRSIEKAGEAREYIDYDIGHNMTVLATKCMPLFVDGSRKKILQGRVKTATLSMVVQREQDIKSFKKSFYYRVVVDFGNFKAELNTDFQTQEQAQAVLIKCTGKPCIVKNFEIKNESKNAPRLYNTTAIEAAANRKYGFTPKQTSNMLEKMYMPKRVSTYPRTSSTCIADDRKEQIAEIVKMLMASKYKDFFVEESKWTPFSKKHFNSEKVHGHPAITPTLTDSNSVELSEDEKKIHDMLCRSILALVLPQSKYEKRMATITIGDYDFVATSKKRIERGWEALYEEEEETSTDVSELPILNIGDVLTPQKLLLREVAVAPPRAFTLASLVEAMEVAGQNVDDEEIAELMRSQEKALGTGATRNRIIDDLFRENYLSMSGNTVHPTAIGTWIIKNFPVKELKDVMFTAEMEHQLFLIQQGKVDEKEYVKKISSYVKKWSDEIKNAKIKPIEFSSTGNLKCPNCNGKLVTRGNYWMCQNFKSKKDKDYSESSCTFCLPIMYKGELLSLMDLEKLSQKKATSFHKFFFYRKDDKNKENPIEQRAYLFWDAKSKCIKESNVVPKCKCPICGAEIQATATGYRCANHTLIDPADKEKGYKCKFYVPLKFLGATISLADIKHIVSGEVTAVKNLKKHDGEKFCASLFWDKEDQKLGFKYTVEGVKCPACGGAIKVTSQAWYCENYEIKLKDENGDPILTEKGKQKRQCTFYLSKDFYGNKLKESDLKAICNLEATRKLTFTNKNGKEYQSPIRYDKSSGYISRDFQAGKIMCPICRKGEMVFFENKQGKKMWFCSEKCGFITNAVINGVLISETTMTQLVEKGISSAHTFQKKDGSGEYKARFKIDYHEKKLQLVFVKTRKKNNG